MEAMKDAFAGADVSSYDADLSRGLRLSGENKEFFAQGRLAVLARRLTVHGGSAPLRILDYGCAAGETTLLLADRWPAAQITGVDTSESLIGEARGKIRGSRCAFRVLSELPADAVFDLIYCNGVFHHVAPRERADVLAWIRRHLAPGGFFALWENNSWNPGTRWIMSRVPLTPFLRAALEALPGAIIIATVVPLAVRGGLSAWIGVASAALAMIVIRKDIAALAAGMGAVIIARALGFP